MTTVQETQDRPKAPATSVLAPRGQERNKNTGVRPRQCPIETGAVLATFDAHFRKVPGLRLWDRH